MFQEKRPTCVTVIGWAWIIIGLLMCFSLVMAVCSFVMMLDWVLPKNPQPRQIPDILFFLIFYPLFAIIQFCVGIIALIAGISFLKLKPWSRSVLEVLTWLLLLLIAGSAIFWLYHCLTITPTEEPPAFRVIGIIMGSFIFTVYGIPLAIMLKYLRGDKVKNAMICTNRKTL